MKEKSTIRNKTLYILVVKLTPKKKDISVIFVQEVNVPPEPERLNVIDITRLEDSEISNQSIIGLAPPDPLLIDSINDKIPKFEEKRQLVLDKVAPEVCILDCIVMSSVLALAPTPHSPSSVWDNRSSNIKIIHIFNLIFQSPDKVSLFTILNSTPSNILRTPGKFVRVRGVLSSMRSVIFR